MKKILALFLTFIMLLTFAACSHKTVETETSPSAGKTADPNESAVTRCVIYSSSLAAVLDAFGKTDCIVGAYGSLAEAYNVPSCGKWNEVDVEAVIATGADAVFGFQKHTTEDQIALLESAGITCYFIELSDPDTVAAEITELGNLFACQEKAQVFVDLYNQYDGLLKERLTGVAPVNAYIEGTSSSPKTANSTSAAHKLVTGAGLVNLYAGNETQYPQRNLEDVIVRNPDVIVKLCSSGTALDVAAYDAYVGELAGVAAADNGNVILLNSECGTTATGAVIGRLYIAKYVYPQLFADVDVDAVYETLCTGFFSKEYTGSGAFFK